MVEKAEESKNALFVYTVDDSGSFWVFDGANFHRFLWHSEGLWFIRSQDYLPEYSFGKCLTLNIEQRQEIENEVAGHGITLPFFDNEIECNSFALLVSQNQVIYDCALPGGYFYTANI